jgi:Raf kinase inhibitor-like YbhB/YbcL family protein
MKFSISIFLLTTIVSLNANALNLNIPSYPQNGIIPDDYTCRADDFNGISPQLLWSDAPINTMSFAVVFNDETLNFLHWKLYNIDPSVFHIPEDKPINVGTEGITNFGQARYGGPCPPSTGNYVMTVYALNTLFANEPSVSQIQSAAIESASWAAFRSNNSVQERYEYSAMYRVTFNADWTSTSHPIDFPGASAHFTSLVGNTHNSAGQIWDAGAIATNGIEQMAELGATNILNAEINTVINSGGSESRINGADANNVDSVAVEFTVSESHPLFSLVTMIAPSPDWFIGAHDLDLRENGVWKENFTLNLLPYDAGTQDGASFTTPGGNTNPRQPIERIITNPFPNGTPLGTFVFERLSVFGTAGPLFENGFEE